MIRVMAEGDDLDAVNAVVDGLCDTVIELTRKEAA